MWSERVRAAGRAVWWTGLMSPVWLGAGWLMSLAVWALVGWAVMLACELALALIQEAEYAVLGPWEWILVTRLRIGRVVPWMRRAVPFDAVGCLLVLSGPAALFGLLTMGWWMPLAFRLVMTALPAAGVVMAGVRLRRWHAGRVRQSTAGPAETTVPDAYLPSWEELGGPGRWSV
ncbi:hypothetical protein GCM10023196_060360 [Actinoallomurus vinaceus]|uniref:Uncharacterized protein n=1 Tax=Actinoallomurus vinaceus TaxID=1080074 RepID=A0ABP8UGA7_9ACTN